MIIKNIIENEKPDKIFASENLSEIIKLLITDNIKCKFFQTLFSQKLHWDEITIKQNIGRLPKPKISALLNLQIDD